MLEAVRQDRRALQFAANELRGDRELVLEAVRQDWMALELAANALAFPGVREV